MASRIIAGRAKGLPAIPNLASAMQGAGLQLLINAQIGGPLSGVNLKTFVRFEIYRF